MDFLPDLEEREQLIARTADLIAQCGFAAYVSAPLLAPTDRYFPDSWEPTERGLQRLARRLLRYANLDTVPASAIIDGIPDDRPEELDLLTGMLAREVARTLLQKQRLEDDERLIDVATVYLGFGLFTVNNSYRYRSWGGLHGDRAVTEWSHSSVGVLSPQAMSFLLALQVLARGDDEAEVASQLEPNQAACFRAALKNLRPPPSAPSALTTRLRLPPRSAWPKPPALPPAPIANDEIGTGEIAAVEEKEPLSNQGRPVFRMYRTAAVLYSVLGGCLGVVMTMLSLFRSESSLAIVGPIALGIVGGAFVGRRRRRDFCSKCEATLAPDAADCWSCGGVVRGQVRDRAELMDALDSADPGDAELEALALAAAPPPDEDEERDY